MGVPNGYTSAQVVQAVPTGIQSALVYITGGTITDTTSVNNCFSATYLNYKLVFSNLVSGNTSTVKLRMRASGTDNTSSVYNYSNAGQNLVDGSTINLGANQNQNAFSLGYANDNADGLSFSIDFFSPQAAKNTHYGPGSFWNIQPPDNYVGIISGLHKSTTSFDGFTIFPTSSTLAGSYKVYGYANS